MVRRAGVSIGLLILVLTSPVRLAAADGTLETIVGSVDYVISGTAGGRDRRIALGDVTDLKVKAGDGRIATKMRVTMIDGRAIDLGDPRITLGAGWYSGQDFPLDAEGKTTLASVEGTTLGGLLNFLQDGDERARMAPVRPDRLRNASMRRLQRAVERAGQPSPSARAT